MGSSGARGSVPEFRCLLIVAHDSGSVTVRVGGCTPEKRRVSLGSVQSASWLPCWLGLAHDCRGMRRTRSSVYERACAAERFRADPTRGVGRRLSRVRRACTATASGGKCVDALLVEHESAELGSSLLHTFHRQRFETAFSQGDEFTHPNFGLTEGVFLPRLILTELRG